MKLTNKVLYRSARPFEDFGPVTQNKFMLAQMFAFMRKNRGLGMAAPQIGVSRRLFVMETDGQSRACFNPEIISAPDDLNDFVEGCLSFPGEECTIKRPQIVTVHYQTVSGDWVEETLYGMAARCFQHELDHLNGITIHHRAKQQYATES
jgi:peptide deformylase